MLKQTQVKLLVLQVTNPKLILDSDWLGPFTVSMVRYDSSNLGPKNILEKADSYIQERMKSESITNISCGINGLEDKYNVFEEGAPEGIWLVIDITFKPYVEVEEGGSITLTHDFGGFNESYAYGVDQECYVF